MTQELRQSAEYDVFENDLFLDEEPGHETIDRWGVLLLHILKGAFVLYSGAHNVRGSAHGRRQQPLCHGGPNHRRIGVRVYHLRLVHGRDWRPHHRPRPNRCSRPLLAPGHDSGQLGHCSR